MNRFILDGQDGDKMKKTSSLGRFFRNMGIRRSGKKNQYKPHDGKLTGCFLQKSLICVLKFKRVSLNEEIFRINVKFFEYIYAPPPKKNPHKL